jgi:hypothetical protein
MMRTERLSPEARKQWMEKLGKATCDLNEALVALAVGGEEAAMFGHKEVSETLENVWEQLREGSVTRESPSVDEALGATLFRSDVN